MSSIIEQLKNVEKDEGIACGDPQYLLEEIRSVSSKVIEIDSSNWLSLKSDEAIGEGWMEFALFTFSSSGVDDSDFRVTVVFHGCGPSGNLREFRHIYWGPNGDGYNFYLPGKAVIKALEILSEYFDMR